MKTAVIIDDEPFIRDVVKALGHWEDLGIEIAGEAADGMAGLELVNGLSPDIVITDIKMPRLDGLSLACALNKMEDPPQIIIISGYDDFELVRQALKCGVSDYLLKPIKEKELNEQLKSCVRKSAKRGHKKIERFPMMETQQWLPIFHEHQKRLADQIHSGDSKIIRKSFSELLYDLKATDVGLPEAIYCYYSLIDALHQYVLENAAITAEYYNRTEWNYVFGSNDEIDEILEHACLLFCRISSEVQQKMRQRSKLDISLVQRFIRENIDQNLSLKLVADHFHVSREYLSRRFRQECGKNFSDDVFAQRMQRAKELIIDFKVPIKDAWQMMNFVDQTHFYKCFKRYFGKAPGEMRIESNLDNEKGQV